jgi:hypothetical protein
MRRRRSAPVAGGASGYAPERLSKGTARAAPCGLVAENEAAGVHNGDGWRTRQARWRSGARARAGEAGAGWLRLDRCPRQQPGSGRVARGIRRPGICRGPQPSARRTLRRRTFRASCGASRAQRRCAADAGLSNNACRATGDIDRADRVGERGSGRRRSGREPHASRRKYHPACRCSLASMVRRGWSC